MDGRGRKRDRGEEKMEEREGGERKGQIKRQEIGGVREKGGTANIRKNG